MALDTLIQLHETHVRLAEIEELKGDLPDLLIEQENDFDRITNEQEEHSLKIDELSKELTSCQNTLDDYNAKLEKYNNQLLQVTNNKEYDAVLLEIDHLKTLISDISTQIGSINTQKDELASFIDTNKPVLEELSETIKINKSELDSKMLETDKEEQLLSKNSDQLTKKITDDPNFTHYTKLYEKYGQGMAHISRQSCSHCYTQLPPQTLVEIEYDKKVITCPSCSVFLYHKNDNN
mgnify:CR=1 FL=1